MTTIVMADHVLAITQDMFTAMIDGEPGLLTDWTADDVILTDPVHAWVDVQGDHPARTMVTTGWGAADRIARALFATGPQETVSREDLRDALGEMANVIGGSLKSLMPQPGVLCLPVVTLGPPDLRGVLVWERRLQWRHHPFIISMWNLGNLDGKEQTP